jgi:hypothetical protein
MHGDDVKAESLKAISEQFISEDVEMIITEDFHSYPIALKKRFPGKHHTINHSSGYYVTGEKNEIHTNRCRGIGVLAPQAWTAWFR